METDAHRAMLVAFYEMWSTGDESAVEELFAEDFTDHSSNFRRHPNGTSERVDRVVGRDGFVDFLRWERAGLPDMIETPLAMICEGEYASGLYRLTGTNLGGFDGAEPTGQRVDFVGMDWFKIKDGRFTDWWYSEHDLTGEEQ